MTANPEAIYNQALADLDKLALDHRKESYEDNHKGMAKRTRCLY